VGAACQRTLSLAKPTFQQHFFNLGQVKSDSPPGAARVLAISRNVWH
jgi:hypothetical protein